jgi:hypothetical protein
LLLLLFLVQQLDHSLEQWVIGESPNPGDDVRLGFLVSPPDVRLRAAVEVVFGRLGAKPQRSDTEANA